MQVLIPAILISSCHIVYADNVKEDCLGLLVRKKNGALECQECLKCPAGMQPDPPCHTGKEVKEGEYDKHCVPCPKGFYKETHGGKSNSAACSNCNDTRCRENYKVLSECTPTHPEICSQECIPEYYKNFLDQCVPCCTCLDAQDKMERQCSGYQKQCQSVNGKCKEVPKFSKSTSSTSVQPKSSRMIRSTNRAHQVISTTEQLTRTEKLKTSVQPKKTYFPRQTRLFTKAPSTSSLLKSKETSHALSSTKSTKTAKPVSSSYISTMYVTMPPIIPIQPSKDPFNKSKTIHPGVIVGIFLACLLVIVGFSYYIIYKCRRKKLSLFAMDFQLVGCQNAYQPEGHNGDGAAPAPGDATPNNNPCAYYSLANPGGSVDDSPSLNKKSEQEKPLLRRHSGAVKQRKKSKTAKKGWTAAGPLKTWEKHIKHIEDVPCWEGCNLKLDMELKSANAQLETVVIREMEAKNDTEKEKKLVNKMYKYFCDDGDVLLLQNTEELLEKLSTLRPQLTVAQFVFVAAEMKLNNVVFAIHNQLHS